MRSDEELIASIAATGDSAAFEALLTRYEARIYNYLLRMTRHEQDAQDLTQEVFLRVYRKAGQFNHRHKFTSWLYTIATHAAADSWRRRRPTVALDGPLGPGDDEQTLGDTLASQDESPRAQTEEVLLAQAVRTAVDQLPEPQRTTLLLKEYEQRSLQEISELMGCPPGTVKSRLHYALLRLQELLAPWRPASREGVQS